MENHGFYPIHSVKHQNPINCLQHEGDCLPLPHGGEIDDFHSLHWDSFHPQEGVEPDLDFPFDRRQINRGLFLVPLSLLLNFVHLDHWVSLIYFPFLENASLLLYLKESLEESMQPFSPEK